MRDEGALEGGGRRILIVDDIEENRYMLRSLLVGHGFEVDEAVDGLQALERARSRPPDVVVSDLLMPELDGFALCRAWVADGGLRRIPFIVYTATFTDDRDRQLALDIGASEFIVKPAEGEALVAAILDAWRRAQPRDGPEQSLSDGDFYARYSQRLEEKLGRKVTQLAATRQSLTDYVTRCEAILDASPEAIVSFDGDMKIRSWNFSAERLFGYSEAEALSRPLAMLLPPGYEEQAGSMLAEVRARKTFCRYETRRLRKDGTLVDVAVVLTFLGPEIGFMAVISDLTVIRDAEAERLRLEKQLTHARRMESMGRLAGGVAHDFNNLLTVILAHAAFIEKDLEAGNPLREDARRILEAGERATALTRHLLAFSRHQKMELQIIDLNMAVRSMENMLRRLIGEDIELEVRLAPQVGTIEADLTHVEQVILNLVVNARDALPRGGRMLVETRNAESGRHETVGEGSMEGGQFVTLVVSDDGVGMSDEVQAQIFDPFFTTKAVGKGTGLGLATVYGIVKQADGFISVRSAPGRGSTFEIHWPRVERPAAALTPKGASAGGRGRGETILVVEDEDLVRTLAKRVLERAGYRVLLARDGCEALTLAQNGEAPIDLLLSDVIMPNMNGCELARRIRTLRPSIRVVYMSGYTDDALGPLGLRDGGVCLVEKPFSAAVLTTTIRAVLDGLLAGRVPGSVGELVDET